MKNLYKHLFAALMVTAMGVSAFAQTDDTTTAPAADEGITAEDIRAPSPRLQDPNRAGFFQVGIGPAASFGMDSDNMLYNIFASYNRNFGDRWIGKVLGDAYLASGSDRSRLLNLALGADYQFTGLNFQNALPYVGAAVGFGSARDDNDDTESGVTANIGGGLKFVAADLNWDVSALYSVLTTEVDGSVPSVIGLRAAVNF